MGADCGFHPLIHTLLDFNLTQDIVAFQRFTGLGNELPQTGHTLSDGFTNTVSLHLGHLTGWTFTRLIWSRLRLVIWLFFSPVDALVLEMFINQLTQKNANWSKPMFG